MSDVGITRAEVADKFYDLKRPSDFNGNYTAATAHGMVVGGADASEMMNEGIAGGDCAHSLGLARTTPASGGS